MGKKYLIAVVLALFALPAFAQNERYYEYDEYGQVGRKEGWARRFAHNFYDGLVGAEYYEVIDEEGNKTEKKSNDSKSKKNVSKSYRYYGPGHTPDFYFGVNLLCNDRPPMITEGLPQKPGKGFEFAIAVGQWGYHMTKNIGVNTAFYISRSRYWFDNGQYLNYSRSLNYGNTFVPTDLPIEYGNSIVLTDLPIDDKEVKQGYLRYWSLRIPFCLEISSASRRGPFIAAGPELEFRFADVSKVDFYGEKKAETICKGVNVNPLGLNAVARMGIGEFGILARYSITSLFLEDSPVQTYPFMLGLSASF